MAADLKTLKSSLRIDGDDDDELLKGYLSAATSY
ncbi:head-tail connector protein, partial [Lactiplantibacillus pentosus]